MPTKFTAGFGPGKPAANRKSSCQGKKRSTPALRRNGFETARSESEQYLLNDLLPGDALLSDPLYVQLRTDNKVIRL